MAIGEMLMYWLCHAWWSYIRLELPGGTRCREVEMLREHLRSVLLCLGMGFSTEWLATVWVSLTVVVVVNILSMEMQRKPMRCWESWTPSLPMWR